MSNRNEDISNTVGKLSYWDLLELNGYGNVPMSYMDISRPSYVTGYMVEHSENDALEHLEPEDLISELRFNIDLPMYDEPPDFDFITVQKDSNNDDFQWSIVYDNGKNVKFVGKGSAFNEAANILWLNWNTFFTAWRDECKREEQKRKALNNVKR